MKLMFFDGESITQEIDVTEMCWFVEDEIEFAYVEGESYYYTDRINFGEAPWECSTQEFELRLHKGLIKRINLGHKIIDLDDIVNSTLDSF